MKNMFISEDINMVAEQLIDIKVDFSWRYDSIPAIHKVMLVFRDQSIVEPMSDYDIVILYYMLKKPLDEYFFKLYETNEEMLEHLNDNDDFIAKNLHCRKFSKVLKLIGR